MFIATPKLAKAFGSQRNARISLRPEKLRVKPSFYRHFVPTALCPADSFARATTLLPGTFVRKSIAYS